MSRMYNYPGPALRQAVGETKCLVSAYTNATPMQINTTGTIFVMNLIAAGSSFYNRIGRKIELKSVRVTGVITLDLNTTTQDNDLARIALVYDRQFNGATPAITDIFQDTNAIGTNFTTPLSGVNLNNRDRFLVIMDKRIPLPALTVTTSVTPVPTNVWPNSYADEKHNSFIDEYRKLGNLVTQYKADSSPPVSGDISTGALLLVSYGLNTNGTEGFQMSYWNVRLRYRDAG